MHKKVRYTANRGPVAHVVKVPVTAQEHEEIVLVSELEHASHAETMRRAVREYAAKRAKS